MTILSLLITTHTYTYFDINTHIRTHTHTYSHTHTHTPIHTHTYLPLPPSQTHTHAHTGLSSDEPKVQELVGKIAKRAKDAWGDITSQELSMCLHGVCVLAPYLPSFVTPLLYLHLISSILNLFYLILYNFIITYLNLPYLTFSSLIFLFFSFFSPPFSFSDLHRDGWYAIGFS